MFCNFLLADEINRAPAKVQSALLEVMQERQVTIGHESHRVPQPFLVMATQNPIESEGTYPLPEAQVDRFMFKLVVDYPDDARRGRGRRALARRGRARARRCSRRPRWPRTSAAAAQSYVDRRVMEYAVALTTATREPRRARLGRVRRQPARLDQPDPRRPRARAPARRATTCCRSTCATSRATSCATASCSPTRRSPPASTPTGCSTTCSRADADAADRARARARRGALGRAMSFREPLAARRPGAAAAGRRSPTSRAQRRRRRFAVRYTNVDLLAARRRARAGLRHVPALLALLRARGAARRARAAGAHRGRAAAGGDGGDGHRHVGLDAGQGRAARTA